MIREGDPSKGEAVVRSPAWAALILRAVLGGTFVAHGVQKVVVLGWSGGIPNFRTWGIPLAEVAYPATVVAELGGGFLLLVGLWVRPAAAALTLVMLGALFVVHLPHGFFLPLGIEFVLSLAAVGMALVLLGPGRWALEDRIEGGSFERWLSRRRAR